MDNQAVVEHKIKRNVFWDRFSYILIAVFLAIALIFSGVVIYQKTYFTSTWVNGQSMYPYLNSEVTNNGVKKTFGNASYGDKNLDLVLVDKHDNVMNNIKRFDIIIANTGYADLIKRVIVLPGETFYFGSGSDLGELFIKNTKGVFDKVAQPIEKQYYAVNFYHNYQDAEHPTTLGSDEYFICGDNRAHSTDSRDLAYGPFTKSKIKGVVVAIAGHCDTTTDINKPLTYTNVHYHWPRFIK